VVDPFIELLLKASGSIAGLLVAVYALRQSWADKAETVKQFTALNQERKELQDRATTAIENQAVSNAKLEGAVQELIKEHHRKAHGA
jgi:hypothetical protein